MLLRYRALGTFIGRSGLGVAALWWVGVPGVVSSVFSVATTGSKSASTAVLGTPVT